MNWHLFLDVVAWIWGPLFSIGFIVAIFIGEAKVKSRDGAMFAILATLFWAWIIAG